MRHPRSHPTVPSTGHPDDAVDPDEEATFYARKQIRPEDQPAAAEAAMAKAMASRSNGRR